MTSRSTTILVLLAFALQSIFGGFGRYAAVCLSADHDPGSPAGMSTCSGTCEHDAEQTRLSLHDKHQDDCGCVDIELEGSDYLASHRTDLGDVVDLPIPFTLPCLIAALPEDPVWRGPPVPLGEDFAASSCLAAVTTTRLII